MACAIVDPDAIDGLKIVAHIDVGEAVLVDVAHLHCQTEVPRRRHRFALLVEEPFGIPWHRFEVAPAIIPVEHVRLTHFLQAAIDKAQAFCVRPCQLPLAIDLFQVGTSAGLKNCERPVVGDVQIQITVAIDVRQSEPQTAGSRLQAGFLGHFAKAAVAQIQETMRPLP